MAGAPRCRFCGREIRKKTHTVIFGKPPSITGRVEYWTYRQERPTNKEEAQFLLNAEIVSVRYGVDYSQPAGSRPRFVVQVTTWDGQSYIDPFFCSGKHANLFAYAVANFPGPPIGTEKYYKAVKS